MEGNVSLIVKKKHSKWYTFINESFEWGVDKTVFNIQNDIAVTTGNALTLWVWNDFFHLPEDNLVA